MIKAVIFDIDNTLYSYSVCDNAASAAMKDELSAILGKKISDEVFGKMLMQAKKNVKKYTANTAACHNRMLYSQRILEAAECFTAANSLRIYDAYWNTFLEKMEMYMGAKELLYDIKKKDRKLGFCTDLTAHIQMRKLLRLGISDIADAVVTSEESGVEKPSDIPYQLILDKLGIAPDETVMIGDDFEKDILGAEKVGMHTVLFGSSRDDCICVLNYQSLTEILRGMFE